MTNSRLIVALRIILPAVLCCTAVTTKAATVSFTGADLYNNPDVTLNNTITSLSGSSLVFGPIDVTANQFEKLIALPLSGLGQWADIDGAVVTVSLNLTRLPCLAVFGDSCGPEDHDTVIALGNGGQIVGSEIADNDNGSAFLDEFVDIGMYGQRVNHSSLFQNAGFPGIGESYVVDVTFTLNAGSSFVNAAFLNGSGGSTGSALGRPENLDFLLMRDNGQGEQYQLNTLSISSDSLSAAPVPEPESWVMLLAGLGLVGMAARRRRILAAKHHRIDRLLTF